MESLACIFDKGNFTKLPVHIRLSFCLQTQCKSPLSPLLSFSPVIADFRTTFLQEHVPILHNTIHIDYNTSSSASKWCNQSRTVSTMNVLYCGVKQWRVSLNHWTGIWNGMFIVHGDMYIASAVQSRLSYQLDQLLSRCGYARQPQQLHEQHALVYLLSWAYSVYILLLCCFSSAAHFVTFG